MALIGISDAGLPPPRGVALLALGFRPFYLLAGAYAALTVPLWALQFAGWLPGVSLWWHAHEMLFGYTFAVIAGFLLTAVRAWTSHPTPTGAALAAMAALWIAARGLAPFSLLASSLVDALFALAVAYGIGRPILASRNRNWYFIVFVLALGMAASVVAYSVVSQLLLRALPYPEPDRLVTVWERRPDAPGPSEVAPGNFLDWRERARTFEPLAGAEPYSYDYTGGDRPEVFRAVRVTEGFVEAFPAIADRTDQPLHGLVFIGSALFSFPPVTTYPPRP